jgi:hypothetical protein
MKKVSLFSVIMVAIMLIVIVLSIAFPVRKAFVARDDRLIEKGMSDLVYEINNEYAQKGVLPQALSDLSIENDDTKAMLKKDLVAYKILENNTSSQPLDTSVNNYTNYLDTNAKYELCVTYKTEKNESSRSTYYSSNKQDGFETYVDTYSHPAGEVCYKLKTGY